MGEAAAKRVMIVGLDCAEPSLVFERWPDRLPVLSGLAERGVSGRLTSVVPPITVPAWSCMMASRTPGDLGVYGFRNRSDHTYDGKFIADSTRIHAPRLWDLIGQAGGQSALTVCAARLRSIRAQRRALRALDLGDAGALHGAVAPAQARELDGVRQDARL